jgi:hypothetical protein
MSHEDNNDDDLPHQKRAEQPTEIINFDHIFFHLNETEGGTKRLVV